MVVVIPLVIPRQEKDPVSHQKLTVVQQEVRSLQPGEDLKEFQTRRVYQQDQARRTRRENEQQQGQGR